MKRLYIIHRYDKADSASVRIRGLDFVKWIIDQGGQAILRSDKDIEVKAHTGDIFIFIKPRFLQLPSRLAKQNSVIIDPLDDAAELPHIHLPFHFIFSSNSSAIWYKSRFQLHSSRVVFHPFDSRIAAKGQCKLKMGIGYIGNSQKLDSYARNVLAITSISFESLLAGTNFEFHWTLKPRKFKFEPLTKTVTALAVGSFPIINSSELGEILPDTYPFHIPSNYTRSDLERLEYFTRSDEQKKRAASIIKGINLSNFLPEQTYRCTFSWLLHLPPIPRPSRLNLALIALHDYGLKQKQRLRNLYLRIRT